MASDGTTGFFHDTWMDTWGRAPIEPPRAPRPWLDRLLRRPPPAPPAPTPWLERLLSRDRVRAEPVVAATSSASSLPLFRALGVPIAIGLFFSFFSLLVGADIGGRLRGLVPHRTHVVKPGESLSVIAAGYGLDWHDLYGAGDNRRRHPDPDRIRPGARLDLPVRATLSPLSLSLPLLVAHAPVWADGACAAFSRGASDRSAFVLLLCRGIQTQDATGT